jgi:hypothetical protein
MAIDEGDREWTQAERDDYERDTVRHAERHAREFAEFNARWAQPIVCIAVSETTVYFHQLGTPYPEREES